MCAKLLIIGLEVGEHLIEKFCYMHTNKPTSEVNKSVSKKGMSQYPSII